MLRRRLTFSSFNSNCPHKSVLSGWRRRPYASNSNAAAAEAEAEGEAEAPNGNVPKPKVKGKRLPKAERQVMLESFVNQYRAKNAGAFPTVSYAQKELGGSYYVVKSVLQELQYRAKMSPSCPAIEDLPVQQKVSETEPLTHVEEKSTGEVPADSIDQNVSAAMYDLPRQEEGREIKSVTQVEENSTSEMSADVSVQIDSKAIYDTDLNGANGGNLEPKEEAQTSSSVNVVSEEVTTPGPKSSQTEEAQADQHEFVAKEKDLPIGESNRVAHPSLGDTKDMIKQYDDSQRKTEQYKEVPQPDKLSKERSSTQAEDAEPSTTSSLWGNMKSFANGIISLFRKQ
ncbi:unnamed protein product [Malus baccata var. baccata]